MTVMIDREAYINHRIDGLKSGIAEVETKFDELDDIMERVRIEAEVSLFNCLLVWSIIVFIYRPLLHIWLFAAKIRYKQLIGKLLNE